MDEIDVQMLSILQIDGRISISHLSEKLSLSRPSVTERLHRLREKGIIEKFAAIVCPKSIGRNLLVMIELNDLKATTQTIESIVTEDSRIIECHRATGHVHYYIKAAVTDMDDLQQLIEFLLPYGNTRTSFLLKTPVKNNVILPPLFE